MRIGLIGPEDGARDALEQAFALLLADRAVRQIIYLGEDAAAEAVAERWASQHIDRARFLERGVELACHGDSEAITALLEEAAAAERVRAIRKLPAPPARAIEMLDKWLVLAVHDKAILDEDDIANTHVVVYGKSSAPDLKRFGPRYFLTPGPVSKQCVGVLELLAQGQLELRVMRLDGEVIQCESARASSARLVVTS